MDLKFSISSISIFSTFTNHSRSFFFITDILQPTFDFFIQFLKSQAKSYALATCHRAENTDDYYKLKEILNALVDTMAKLPVILPLHPRTRKMIKFFGLQDLLAKLIVIDPLPFLDMMLLEENAKLILTDSGGVQKEAFFYSVPCITMRNDTEWIETLEMGWNQLTGSNFDKIISAVDNCLNLIPSHSSQKPYGDGNACFLIIDQLIKKNN